jgi:hypothetical protein
LHLKHLYLQCSENKFFIFYLFIGLFDSLGLCLEHCLITDRDAGIMFSISCLLYIFLSLK